LDFWASGSSTASRSCEASESRAFTEGGCTMPQNVAEQRSARSSSMIHRAVGSRRFEYPASRRDLRERAHHPVGAYRDHLSALLAIVAVRFSTSFNS
jgi:hypothetical protein